MITAIANAYRKAWTTAVTFYKTAALIALAAWIVVGVTSQHSGYAQLTLPLGTSTNQIDAAQLTDNAAKPAKQPTKTATADPCRSAARLHRRRPRHRCGKCQRPTNKTDYNKQLIASAVE